MVHHLGYRLIGKLAHGVVAVAEDEGGFFAFFVKYQLNHAERRRHDIQNGKTGI